ncbi:hypothetical protein EK599_15060 [Vibrio sp. T187]|uniref:hypothetical protein n=1 Tax=Vibrio TaxID=662 RepID=UPI0010CA06EC|nr:MULTISPECIES: hypothetical protein [Vibrio]MBW3697019.1 hypothetical protein [Vibrio sp. T187]
MLLTNKHYTPEAVEIARKIANNVEERHAKWLISMKFLVDQSEVDTLLSLEGRYCEDVIFNEEDRITNNQRILLGCEQERVKAHKQKLEDKQKTLKTVVDAVAMVAEKMMCDKLEETDIGTLFGGIPDFGHFASIAYSPSLNFSKLSTLTTLSRQLSSNILDLVSNPKFSERFGKAPKAITDPKIAIGQIGIENSRFLFPVLMARPTLKWSDANTKLIAPKMWQHLIVTSNVTRMRLKETNVREPDVGILLGTLRVMPLFLICNHFSQVFEDALVYTMTKYREADKREEYYACSEVAPNLVFLPNVIKRVERQLVRKLIEHIEWDVNSSYIKQALLEDIDDISILERSEYGAALGQARAYSIFDGLKRSNAFLDKHKPYWFAKVQMSGAALSEVREQMPGKLTLSM